MKKTAIIILLSAISFTAKAQVEKVEIKTSAICQMCKETLEHDMAFEKGVKSSNLDLETKIFFVTYNPGKTTADKIRKRITMVGYNADSLSRDPKAYENLPECCKDGAHSDEN